MTPIILNHDYHTISYNTTYFYVYDGVGGKYSYETNALLNQL